MGTLVLWKIVVKTRAAFTDSHRPIRTSIGRVALTMQANYDSGTEVNLSFFRRGSWLLLVMSVSVCHAQIFGTVRGTVQDPQQAAIPNARVTLKAQVSTLTKQTQTDSEGVFIVNALPAGPYTILIEREGFSTISQALSVAIGSAPLLKFSMTVSSITTVTQVIAPLDH
jgi:hypothetical protein